MKRAFDIQRISLKEFNDQKEKALDFDELEVDGLYKFMGSVGLDSVAISADAFIQGKSSPSNSLIVGVVHMLLIREGGLHLNRGMMSQKEWGPGPDGLFVRPGILRVRRVLSGYFLQYKHSDISVIGDDLNGS